MKRTMRWVGVGLVFSLGWGVAGVQAQQPEVVELQAPSRRVQTPTEVVPTLPVPRLVKFAGTMKDGQGKPRTGVVGVTFAIYKEQDGGAALWLETQNVELDEQGHYTVLLGATKNEGLALELFSAGEPRWLGVQVNLPGEVEQPRVLLVSVPYALKAVDAETVGGMPASAFVLAAPNGTAYSTSTVSTATQTSTSRKMTGKATTNGPAKGAAAATPIATNFIPVFIDNSGTLGSSAMLQSGSNIGIGTTTPGATLDVNGVARALSFGFTGNAAPPTDATATILNQANVGPVFSGLSFKVRTGAPVPADALSVDQNHNASITGNASALAYKFTGNATPPTDATATIFNQANVGPTFSGLSFSVQTGAPVPGTALTVDQNHNLRISGGGALVFPDGTVQTSSASTRGITFLAGCDTCALLADTDSEQAIYVDVVGSMTILSVACYSDAGNPIINIQRDTGVAANILTSNLTCSPTGASSSSFVVGQNVLNIGDKLDFAMVTAGGQAHRVTAVIQAIVN